MNTEQVNAEQVNTEQVNAEQVNAEQRAHRRGRDELNAELARGRIGGLGERISTPMTGSSRGRGRGVSASLAGNWTVRFGVLGLPHAKKRLTARVRVQSSGNGAFHGGKLDLHVHVPKGLVIDGTEVDPANAGSDPGMKVRVDSFFVLTTKLLGIERGEVVFSEEPKELSALDGDEAIVKAFGSSSTQSSAPTAALHLDRMAR